MKMMKKPKKELFMVSKLDKIREYVFLMLIILFISIYIYFILIVHQFPFRLISINEQSLPIKPPTPTPPQPTITNNNNNNSLRIQNLLNYLKSNFNVLKRIHVNEEILQVYNLNNLLSTSNQSLLSLLPPPLPPIVPHTTFYTTEPIKVLPLTIFDFNGSSEYYEHIVSIY